MKRQLPLTYDEFKTIYSKVPRLCVDLIIKNSQGILLLLRKDYGYVGQWHFPGGTVYLRESLHETVKRVAKTETGFEVKIEKLLGYIEYFNEVVDRGYGYTISVVFECTPTGKTDEIEDEACEQQFFKELPEKMINEQKDYLQNFLKSSDTV